MARALASKSADSHAAASMGSVEVCVKLLKRHQQQPHVLKSRQHTRTPRAAIKQVIQLASISNRPTRPKTVAVAVAHAVESSKEGITNTLKKISDSRQHSREWPELV